MAIADHRRDSQVNRKPDRLWTRTTSTIITKAIITTKTTTALHRDGVGGANGDEPIQAQCTVTYGKAVISHLVSFVQTNIMSDDVRLDNR